MLIKEKTEWFVDCPWGKLAMVSWGDPADPPILAVHGYLDNAATFENLIICLPHNYFFVAIDLPGNGKSDPFPDGVVLSQAHLVEPIRIAVKKMNWNKFIYMAHSMSCAVGILYNAVFPGKISKVINLDPLNPIEFQIIMDSPHPMATRYEGYYDNYEKFKSKPGKKYTYEEAVNTLARNRNLTVEQAELILSRALVPAGDGLFRLSWDQKIKQINYLNLPKETFFKLITINKLPTLNIHAIESRDSASQNALKFVEEVEGINDRFLSVFVEGGHDVHLTDPEAVATHIVEFLERDFNLAEVKSKL